MRQVTARVNSAAERIRWLRWNSVSAQLELHALQTAIGFVGVHMEIGSRLAFSLQFCVVTSCRLPVGETADCQSALRRWSRHGSRQRLAAPAWQRKPRREAEGRGRGRNSGGDQRAAAMICADEEWPAGGLVVGRI